MNPDAELKSMVLMMVLEDVKQAIKQDDKKVNIINNNTV